MHGIWLRYNLRSMEGGASTRTVCETAIEQVAWARFGPYALHEMRSYTRWAEEGGAKVPFCWVETVEQLRSTGVYQVLTPGECLAFARSQRDANRLLTFHPLTSGLPADLSWSSLELFVTKVLPSLRREDHT